MCNGNVIKVNKCGATTTTARKKKIKTILYKWELTDVFIVFYKRRRRRRRTNKRRIRED